MSGDREPSWREPGATSWYTRSELPAYTASFDDIAALVREWLPEWRVSMLHETVKKRGDRWVSTGWECELQKLNGLGCVFTPEKNAAAIPALAMATVFCCAMAHESREFARWAGR